MAEKRKLPPGVSEAFRELMEDPISFFPALARLCGSATAGLMLSQAVYWSGNKEVIARDGWFWKTAGEWEQETCLSSKEQRTARETILKLGFWEEEKHKINGAPTLHFRVKFDVMIEAHIDKCRAKMESAKRANQDQGDQEPESDELENGKCQKGKSIENDETANGTPDLPKKENDETANLYIQRLHSETTREHTESTATKPIGYLATLEAIKQSTARQTDLYQPERLLLDATSGEEFNSIEVAIAICGELALVGDKSRLLMDKALVAYRIRHQDKSWKTCGEELLALWQEYQQTVTGQFALGFKSFFEDGWYLKREKWAKKPNAGAAPAANDFLAGRRERLGAKAHE